MKKQRWMIYLIPIIPFIIALFILVNTVKFYIQIKNKYKETTKYPWFIEVIETSLYDLTKEDSYFLIYDDISYVTSYAKFLFIPSSDFINEKIETISYQTENQEIYYYFGNKPYNLKIYNPNIYLLTANLSQYFTYHAKTAFPEDTHYMDDICKLYQIKLAFFQEYYYKDLNKEAYIDLLKLNYLSTKFYEITQKAMSVDDKITPRGLEEYKENNQTDVEQFRAYVIEFDEFLSESKNQNILQELAIKYHWSE